MCGTKEPMSAGVPGGFHPNVKNMISGGFRVPGKFGLSGFWVPGRTQKVDSSGFRVGTQKVSSEFRPKFFCAGPWSRRYLT